jgi:hypothetical protein
MASNTYVALDKKIVTGSAVASVEFTGISSAYTDLVIVASNIVASASFPNIQLRFNSDTGTNYSFTQIYGNGTSAGSDRAPNYSSIIIPFPDRYTTSAGYIQIANIQNYSNTTTYKTLLGRSGNAGSGTSAAVGMWRNTAAITSITITAVDANFASGSTFTLYGIKSE